MQSYDWHQINARVKLNDTILARARNREVRNVIVVTKRQNTCKFQSCSGN